MISGVDDNETRSAEILYYHQLYGILAVIDDRYDKCNSTPMRHNEFQDW